MLEQKYAVIDLYKNPGPTSIYPKRELTHHKFATLTHISAQIRRKISFWRANSSSFVYNILGQGYESIWISGEDMRQ